MPLCQWISTGPGRHNEDTEAEGIKPIEGIKDAWPHSKREEGHRYTDLLTEIMPQEEHASNADKWDISPETAQERRKGRTSISSTTMIVTNQSIFHQPLFPEITWLR